MTIQEKYYEKLKADYNEFIESLVEMQPFEIIDRSYEKVMKEEILGCFEDFNYLDDEQVLQMFGQNAGLDDLYNNYMKMDVSIRQMIEDCNDYFLQERLEELPGSEIEGINIAGYEIERAIMFDNNRGFAFGHSGTAVDPYVTWQFNNENGKFNDFFWGNYFRYEEDALASFVARANEYAQSNNAKEVSMAGVLTQIEQQSRTYKAEIHNTEEPECPHLEVFRADTDAESVEEAYVLADSYPAGAYLLEVHELDENYDSIRQIDLVDFGKKVTPELPSESQNQLCISAIDQAIIKNTTPGEIAGTKFVDTKQAAKDAISELGAECVREVLSGNIQSNAHQTIAESFVNSFREIERERTAPQQEKSVKPKKHRGEDR